MSIIVGPAQGVSFMYPILRPCWDDSLGCVLSFEKKKIKLFEGQKETNEDSLLIGVLGTGLLPLYQLK